MRIVTCYQANKNHIDLIKTTCPGWEVVVSNNKNLPRDILTAKVFFGHVKSNVDWDKVVREGELAFIQSSAAGLDHCLTTPVRQSNIQVASASAVFANSVAEQTMALLYGLLRSIPIFVEAQSRKEFVRQPTDDLHGKRIGIVGFGGNGQRIAELLRPVGCQIWATDIFPNQKTNLVDRLLPASELNEMLGNSDVLIVTVPLLETTFHLIGEPEFQLLPRGSYLINVARGSVVDEIALVESIQDGHLAGAGIDVAEIEPLPASSELWDTPKVLISPHVGAQSKTRNDDVTRLFCENMTRWENGNLINLVDKEIGFPRPEFRYHPGLIR